MTVAEVIQLPSFSSSRIIAGEEGINNTVSSAMILEAADIEKWGNAGQAIITSFYATNGMTEEELLSFFEKIALIGISCIIFKPERLVNVAPVSIVQKCNQYRIPLIQIAKDVKYEAVLIDIFTPILEKNLSTLNRFYDTHNKLMVFALKEPSIQQILNYLRTVISCDATYYNVKKKESISTDSQKGTFTNFVTYELEGEKNQHYLFSKAELRYSDNSSTDALAIPFSGSGDNKYYLFIHNGLHLHLKMDIMDIENVLSLLIMETLKQEAIERERYIQHNNDIQNLLNGSLTAHESIDLVVENHGIHRFLLYQVLLVSLHPSTVNSEKHHDEVSALRTYLQSKYPTSAFYESNQQVCFVCNFDAKNKEIRPDEVEVFISKFLRSRSNLNSTYIASVSQVGTRYNISSMYREVSDICRLFDGSGNMNRCFTYNNLGLFKIFLQIKDKSEFNNYLDPRLMHMKTYARYLFEMIILLCENDLDYQKTAESLFVHPKTIQYRLNKIREKYDIDIHDSNDRLQILIAGKILLLQNEHP